MKTHHINAASLNIDLASRKETELFKWFLACLLFGKPIQQEIAAEAYKALEHAGITRVTKLIETDWDTLVHLLDGAHYVRYDFSTATKLLAVGHDVKRLYGTVSGLLRQAGDATELHERLVALHGIGPMTALIFIRDVAPIWFTESLPHDYESAVQTATILGEHGFKAYIIGGAVRDLWLGHTPKDFDLVTNAMPNQIMAIPEFKRSSYNDPAQAFGVTRVKLNHRNKEHEIEIATFRRDIDAHLGRKATKIEFADLEDDVMRRDLTINALALDPLMSQIIDYVDGLDDLEHRIIRFIGNPAERIREDPLRVMRAIRLKNQLEFVYHTDTIRAIKNAATDGVIEKIATDRLRNELTNILVHPSRRQAIQDLDEFGILERVLPEVTAGKNVAQPGNFHAEGDVWQHELLILEYLPSHPSPRLVWAALLHDIGKVPTAMPPRVDNDRIRFNRHYAVGAEMTKSITDRLNFPGSLARDIVWMIYNHMGIDDLPSMRPSHQQKMMGNPAFEDLLELHRADAAASWRPHQLHHAKPRFRSIERLWHDYQSKPPRLQQPSLKHDLGIDGTWLMKHFGDQYDLSGPEIGRLLKELDEWYRDERVEDMHAYVVKADELIRQLKP